MKGIQSSGDYSVYNRNKNESVDPAAIEAGTVEILSPEGYNIPEREVKTWCSFMERGFRASRNMMNKQPGTHTEVTADVIEEDTSMKILHPEKHTE